MKVTLRDYTPAFLSAEDISGAALSGMLGVAEPPEWPPLFNDAETRAWFRRTLESDPSVTGWLGFYVIAEIDGRPTLSGTAGFKGPPNADGVVEIGYSIVEKFQRRGIASAAVAQLVDRAFADPRVEVVTAETLPSLAASRGLLEKCGFVLTGTRTDPDEGEIVLYARTAR